MKVYHRRSMFSELTDFISQTRTYMQNALFGNYYTASPEGVSLI